MVERQVHTVKKCLSKTKLYNTRIKGLVDWNLLSKYSITKDLPLVNLLEHTYKKPLTLLFNKGNIKVCFSIVGSVFHHSLIHFIYAVMHYYELFKHDNSED